MTDLGLELDLKELDNMANILNSLTIGGKKKLLMKSLANSAEGFTRRRLQEEKTDPKGKAWQEWSATTKQMRSGNQSLLQLEGDLLDSLHSDISGNDLWVGSENLPYAAIHNFGGQAGRGKKIKIPQRQWLGVSKDNEDELAAIVDKVLFGL